MKKLKLFIENILVYGVGGIISKIIPLIMVPIITRIMPDQKYYGLSDMSNTVIQLGRAVAVMGMYDAMYRMFFEKDDEEYKKRVCSTALIFTLFTSLLVFLLMLLLRQQIASFFFKDKQYAYIVYLSAMATLVGATNSIVAAPTRMQNKRKIFLITNTISPILSYSLSVPLLLAGHYVIALPLAAVVSGITMEISFAFLNHKWFSYRIFDRDLLRQMLKIAIPLFPNFLIYWVFNSCDRVMITSMIDVGASGVYSVGSKLGHASQLVYTAFAGGWQFFAFSTMSEKDQVKSNSQIFEYLGAISFTATSFICAISYGFYKIIFPEEYLEGFIVAPYLFLAPLLQMMFQVASNQFLVVKKTWPNLFILSTGAIVNLLFNYFFIPILGIEGAAIATLLGYLISDIICVIVLCKMRLMVISSRFLFLSLLMGVVVFLWRGLLNKTILIGMLMAAFFTLIVLYFYRSEISNLITQLKKKHKGKL